MLQILLSLKGIAGGMGTVAIKGQNKDPSGDGTVGTVHGTVL